MNYPEALRLKIVEESDARRNDTRFANSSAMVAKKSYDKRTVKKKNWNNSKGETFKYKCHKCRKTGHKAADCKESTKGTDEAKKSEEVSLHTYPRRLFHNRSSRNE